MSIPTFPAPHRSDNLQRFVSVIDDLLNGKFARSTLIALSDLDRAQLARLHARWGEIPEGHRIRLLRLLCELSAESVMFDFNRVFRLALKDASPLVRQLGIGGLWEDTGSDLPTILFDVLETDPSEDVRAQAALALADTCDSLAAGDMAILDKETVVDRLVSIARNAGESAAVRTRCLGTVAAFGDDPRVVRLIQETLANEDQALVAAAIYALGRTSNVRWLPRILEHVSSEDAELRFESARAAGLIGDASVVPDLAELARDQDDEVRGAAIDALGKIGGPAAIRVLRLLASGDQSENANEISFALQEALVAIDPIGRPS
jgi:HEAT repeats